MVATGPPRSTRDVPSRCQPWRGHYQSSQVSEPTPGLVRTPVQEARPGISLPSHEPVPLADVVRESGPRTDGGRRPGKCCQPDRWRDHRGHVVRAHRRADALATGRIGGCVLQHDVTLLVAHHDRPAGHGHSDRLLPRPARSRAAPGDRDSRTSASRPSRSSSSQWSWPPC